MEKCWLRNSCIVYEGKPKDCAGSWTFQHKSRNLCLLFWYLPGFITIPLYKLCSKQKLNWKKKNNNAPKEHDIVMVCHPWWLSQWKHKNALSKDLVYLFLMVAKLEGQYFAFLSHRSLIKNKNQTAVINILNLHILFIKTWRFVCDLLSKVTVEIY